MRFYYAGIDPGKKGSLAVIYPDGTVHVSPLSEIQDLIIVLKALSKEHCRVCLEKVHSMPQQGVSSTFTFGVQYGWIKGVLDACNISYQEIPPQRWKKEFGLNTDKQKSIEVCRQLFPTVSLRPSERCRVDDNNMAEAVLMAEYARRKL